MRKKELVANIEHRYAEEYDEFKLQSWAENAVSKTYRGLMHQRPEWLVHIVDVARVANAFEHTTHPPPQAILWFKTDGEFNLVALMRTFDDYQIKGFVDP